MSSVTVCNCPQNTLDPACLCAVSSRPSDQQQKKPDGRMCWVGSVGWRLDNCWLKTQSLAENSVQSWCAVVGQIPRNLTALAWAHQAYTGLVGTFSQCSSVCMSLDRLWSNFRVSLTTRTAVFNTHRSLSVNCNDLWRSGENCIAIIHTGRRE